VETALTPITSLEPGDVLTASLPRANSAEFASVSYPEVDAPKLFSGAYLHFGATATS
jgi:hypothetical protein